MSGWDKRAKQEFQIESLELARLVEFADFDDEPGESLLLQVIDLYFDSGHNTFESIKVSFQSGDLNTLHKSAHGLRSSSANVGAKLLSSLLLKIEETTDPEQTARNIDSPLMTKTEIEFRTVCRDLEIVKCLVLGLEIPARLKRAA